MFMPTSSYKNSIICQKWQRKAPILTYKRLDRIIKQMFNNSAPNEKRVSVIQVDLIKYQLVLKIPFIHVHMKTAHSLWTPADVSFGWVFVQGFGGQEEQWLGAFNDMELDTNHLCWPFSSAGCFVPKSTTHILEFFWIFCRCNVFQCHFLGHNRGSN